MTRFTTCSVAFFFSAVLLAFAPSALAVDGTVLINQNTSVNGLPGCTHSGFPIIICNSGNYRLSGNVTATDVNTDAVDITADNVTLDLNGFAISGPVTCTKLTYPVQCSDRGSAIGIKSTNDNITVTNGTVRGMGNSGIQLRGAGNLVEGVHAENNAGLPPAAGISVIGGTVTRCTAMVNAGDGISGGVFSGTGATESLVSLNTVSLNGGNGIFGASVVSNNTVTRNGQDGIFEALFAANNVLVQNVGFGLHIMLTPGGYTGNVIAVNGGTVNGGHSMGHNLCDAVAC